MTICYFRRQSKTPRNNNVLKELRANRVYIHEINYKLSCNKRITYIRLFFKRLRNHYDAIIEGYDRWLETYFAKILLRKPIIWDAFLSRYNTYVFDRKTVSVNSRFTVYMYYIDLITLKCATVTILSTYAHINLFKEIYPVKGVNYERVLVGSDDSRVFPKKISKNTDKFCVSYYSSFQLIHRIKNIIFVIKELKKEKDILFRLAGYGQSYHYIQNLYKNLKLSNVEFINPLSFEKYIDFMNVSAIVLGTFGITKKAKIAVPHKVYDGLPMAKPVITGDCAGTQELLESKLNCLLCKMGSGKAIADAIFLLKEDITLRKKIALNGYKLLKNDLYQNILGDLS